MNLQTKITNNYIRFLSTKDEKFKNKALGQLNDLQKRYNIIRVQKVAKIELIDALCYFLNFEKHGAIRCIEKLKSSLI